MNNILQENIKFIHPYDLIEEAENEFIKHKDFLQKNLSIDDFNHLSEIINILNVKKEGVRNIVNDDLSYERMKDINDLFTERLSLIQKISVNIEERRKRDEMLEITE